MGLVEKELSETLKTFFDIKDELAKNVRVFLNRNRTLFFQLFPNPCFHNLDPSAYIYDIDSITRENIIVSGAPINEGNKFSVLVSINTNDFIKFLQDTKFPTT